MFDNGIDPNSLLNNVFFFISYLSGVIVATHFFFSLIRNTKNILSKFKIYLDKKGFRFYFNKFWVIILVIAIGIITAYTLYVNNYFHVPFLTNYKIQISKNEFEMKKYGLPELRKKRYLLLRKYCYRKGLNCIITDKNIEISTFNTYSLAVENIQYLQKYKNKINFKKGDVSYYPIVYEAKVIRIL
jgi:hypothetical protein